MTSARGPKARTAPSFSTSILSTLREQRRAGARRPPPSRRSSLSTSERRAAAPRSPSWSRLAFGSSSTTRRGSPYSARASAMRWRWPGESALPALADLGVVALGQAQDQVVHVRALRGAHHRRRRRARPGARCSRRPCRRTARRPAAGSRCAGRARSRGQRRDVGAVEPHRARRRLPHADDQARQRRLARARSGRRRRATRPAASANETPRRIGRSRPRQAEHHALRRSSAPCGAGSAVRASRGGFARAAPPGAARRRAPRPGCASRRPAARPARARGRAGWSPRSSRRRVACCVDHQPGAERRASPIWMHLARELGRAGEARRRRARRASARAARASFSARPAPRRRAGSMPSALHHLGVAHARRR